MISVLVFIRLAPYRVNKHDSQTAPGLLSPFMPLSSWLMLPRHKHSLCQFSHPNQLIILADVVKGVRWLLFCIIFHILENPHISKESEATTNVGTWEKNVLFLINYHSQRKQVDPAKTCKRVKLKSVFRVGRCLLRDLSLCMSAAELPPVGSSAIDCLLTYEIIIVREARQNQSFCF